MRILGHLDHPTLKITVFKMNERVSVQFENEGYEVTFKLGQDDRLSQLEGVRHWVDASLLEHVQGILQQLHHARLAALDRAFPPDQTPVFEEII